MDLGFGPDGNFYVVSTYAGGVFRYNGTTGAFIDHFTTEPSGAEAIRWRGNSMFISGHNDDKVLRFRAQNGTPQLAPSTKAASSTGPLGLISDLMVTFTLPVFSMTQS